MPLEDNGTDRDLHVNIAVRPLADRLIATHSPSGGVQQEDHLIVARRREIEIVLADGHEPPGHRDAYDFVGFVQVPNRLVRGDRRSQNDPRGAEVTGHLTGSSSSRARRDAVVDDDCRATRQVDAVTSPSQTCDPLFKQFPLTAFDSAKVRVGDPGASHDLGIAHLGSALTDRAHGQLGLERHSQLSRHDDIQWRTQCLSHLGRHGHPASGEAQNDHVLVMQVRQPRGQRSACLDTISEHGHRPTPRLRRALLSWCSHVVISRSSHKSYRGQCQRS